QMLRQPFARDAGAGGGEPLDHRLVAAGQPLGRGGGGGEEAAPLVVGEGDEEAPRLGAHGGRLPRLDQAAGLALVGVAGDEDVGRRLARLGGGRRGEEEGGEGGGGALHDGSTGIVKSPVHTKQTSKRR